MTTRFGPQLIGETEKTLNAMLCRALEGSGLNEPQWVTLRVADQLDSVDGPALAAALADRAHFTNPAQLVDQLTERGLLDGGRLTTVGRDLLRSLQAVITKMTAPIWHDLASEDVAAAERLLNEIICRSRLVLDAQH
ncbi:MAG: MarR family transcriptional regulator [Actinobacteria bacterium]|nr:MarR family transcriptional regulator [Actinomycetota bacterium]